MWATAACSSTESWTCCADEGARTLVVDWKSDALGELDPEELTRDHYATQRIIYALAALRAGAERVEVVHCYLERPDEPAVAHYEAADTEALERELLELGARRGRGPFRALARSRISRYVRTVPGGRPCACTNRSSHCVFPSGPRPNVAPMPLCFIEPQEAIRVVAESVGREARRQLLGEVVRAWVDEIPEDELQVHYAKAVEELDDDDLSMLAAWHASLEVGQPIANKEFLLGAFSRLGDHRREALRIAAGFKGEDAFDAGVSEEQALTTVLPWLSDERLMELAAEAVELYCWDRLGCDN